jgi:hypothetical protein
MAAIGRIAGAATIIEVSFQTVVGPPLLVEQEDVHSIGKSIRILIPKY